MVTAAKLVLAGHSHVHALGVPGVSAGEAPRIAAVPFPGADVVGVAGDHARGAAYWDLFIEAARGRVPAVIWAGNQHNAHFLFRADPPIDFVLSSDPRRTVDRAATLVPEAMLRAVFEPSLKPLRALLARLAAVSPAAPIVIGTPPPKGDPVRLCAGMAKESYFAETAATLGIAITPQALAPPALLAKLWRLLQDMMRDCATEAGATFVPVPARLIAPGDLLPDPYWAQDATHANRDYGRKLLREVVRHAAPIAEATAA
jgi:hypothetical protein